MDVRVHEFYLDLVLPLRHHSRDAQTRNGEYTTCGRKGEGKRKGTEENGRKSILYLQSTPGRFVVTSEVYKLV